MTPEERKARELYYQSIQSALGEFAHMAPEEREAKVLARRQQAIAAFPFERVEVPGDQALQTWQVLSVHPRSYVFLTELSQHYAD